MMNMRLFMCAALAAGTFAYAAADVVVENARFRLVLDGDGFAKSLVVKATGEECLEPNARVPFSTITQNRAYDNEFKLMYAAKPWTLPSNAISREGDLLKIRYRDEFFTARVRLETTDDYVRFRLEGFDYELESSGFKRRTETDSFALVQLPIRRRTHFGRTLNVVWDERAAVALMAAQPETRIDAFDRESGGLRFYAGTEKDVGVMDAHAVLAAAPGREPFLDCVDAFERDFDLPRGVQSRRRKDYAASYYMTGDVTPENVHEHIAIAKKGGFRGLLTLGPAALWSTTGHNAPKPKFANGVSDFRKVTDAIRDAGLVPGLHFFSTKVSTNDAYLASGKPDTRMNTVCEIVLDADVSETDRTLPIQGRPRLLRTEPNRGLVMVGDELVMYGGVTEEPPYALTNCVRGLWNSTPARHARNTVARHLDVDDWVVFVRCGGNSKITDEIADRLADTVNGAGVKFFYMDGAEDVPEPFWYHVPRVQLNVWRKFTTDPIYCEGALKSHFGWHVLSRGNAFDTFKGELQRGAMKKYILRTVEQDADDFSSVDLGWMRLQPPVKPDPNRKAPSNGQYAQSAFWNGTIGTQPDVFEYMGAKGAAWNCPVSMGCSLRAYRSHPRADDCLAAFKRWEDAKLNGTLTPAQREMLKDPDREWMLWPFASAEKPEPVECRAATRDDERPIRAFSYVRNGRSGIVYWNLDERDTPEIDVPGIKVDRLADLGRRFVEADVPEADLVRAFRSAAYGSR